MARRIGLSLEEAAGAGPSRESRRLNREEEYQRQREQRFARSVHLMDQEIYLDKARREAALAEARQRGLDAAEERRKNLRRAPRRRPRRIDPQHHAAVLLRETALPFREIAAITGLGVYEVVGLKLKMRRAA